MTKFEIGFVTEKFEKGTFALFPSILLNFSEKEKGFGVAVIYPTGTLEIWAKLTRRPKMQK